MEILDRQTDTFNKFVRVILDSTNERLDNMTRNIRKLKDSIRFTHEDVDDLKSKVSTDQKTLVSGMRTIRDSLFTMENKMYHLDNQLKRNNLLFEGIKESERESWEDKEEKVRNLISQKLNLDVRKMLIERAHRKVRP